MDYFMGKRKERTKAGKSPREDGCRVASDVSQQKTENPKFGHQSIIHAPDSTSENLKTAKKERKKCRDGRETESERGQGRLERDKSDPILSHPFS